MLRKSKKTRPSAAEVLHLGSQTLTLVPIMLIFIDLLARALRFPVELFLLAFGR